MRQSPGTFSQTIEIRRLGVPVEATITGYAVDPNNIKITGSAAGRSHSITMKRIDAVALSEKLLDIAMDL